MTQRVLTGPGAAHDDMPEIDDLSRPALARPSLPATPEEAAFSAYRIVVRTEPCACGAMLQQFNGETVRDVVVLHEADPIHAAWRRRRVA